MNSIPLTPPPRPVLRTPGRAPVLSLLFLVCVPSGCRNQSRKIRYQVVDKPEGRPAGASKPHSAGTRTTGVAPRPRPGAATPTSGLTAAPKLEIVSQGNEPRTKFSIRLPPGLRAIYQVKVSQVTSAPEPIGSFESALDFRLTEKLLENDKEGNPTQVVSTKRRLQNTARRKTGAHQANGKRSADPIPMGLPLQVTLDQIQMTLPKRFHVDVGLMTRKLEGLSYHASLLPDGTLGNLHVQGPVPKDLTASLEQLGRSLNRLQPPIPRQPLGKGAHWRVTDRFEAARHIALPHTDIEVVMVTDYHLNGFEKTPYGRAARISTTITLHGKNHSSAVPIVATGKGQGSIILLIDPTIVVSHRSRTTIDSRVQGNGSSNTSVMALALESLEFSRKTTGSQSKKERMAR